MHALTCVAAACSGLAALGEVLARLGAPPGAVLNLDALGQALLRDPLADMQQQARMPSIACLA